MKGSLLKSLGTVLAIFLSICMILPPAARIGQNVPGGDVDAAVISSITTDITSPQTRSLQNITYAIITISDLSEPFNDLARWKTQKGQPADVFLLDGPGGILNTYSDASDAAQAVRQFLKDRHRDHPELRYVMLGGDNGTLPVRYLHSGGIIGGLDDEVPSDYYFAGLDSNWDANGNGVYGEYREEDWGIELVVGRVPVTTPSDAYHFVNKTLEYEQNPYVGDWMNQVEFWGGLMDAPNDPQIYSPSHHNAYKVFKQNMTGLFKDRMQIHELYDYPQLEGGNYTPEVDSLNYSAAVTALNGGMSVLLYAGQASYTGRMLQDYGDPEGLKDTNTAGSFNWLLGYDDMEEDYVFNKKTPTFAFLATCSCMMYTRDDDQSMERFLTTDRGGFVSAIGPTSKLWRGEFDSHSQGSWWLLPSFWETYLEGNTNVGETFYKTMEEYAASWLHDGPYRDMVRNNLYSLNYFGDPELDVWTERPSSPTVVCDQIYYGPNAVTIQVKTSEGAPVEGARVCLMNTEVYMTDVTNETGHVELAITPSMYDRINLTVTGRNILPYIDVLVVENLESPDYYISPSLIKVDPEKPVAGDKATVSVTIRNVGTVNSPEAKVVLSAGDPTGHSSVPLGGNHSVEVLAPGESATVTQTWVVGGSSFNLYAWVDPDDEIVEIKETNNLAHIHVDVRAPDLALEDTPSTVPFDIDPAYGFSENLETSLVARVQNKGDVTAVDILVAFYDGDPNTDGLLIASDVIGNLTPGAIKVVNATWLSVGGEHDLQAIVDPKDEIPEKSEDNNVRVRTVIVNWLPRVVQTDPMVIDEDTEGPITIDLLDLVSDPDGSGSFRVEKVNTSDDERVSARVENNDTLILNFAEDWSGTLQVFLTLHDGTGQSKTTLTLRVRPVNDPPTIQPLGDRTFSVGERVNISVNATDPDGPYLRFFDDSQLFDIDPDTGRISFVPEESDIGVHVASIWVDDGVITGDLPTVEIRIIIQQGNRPPVIEPIENKTVRPGEILELTIIAEDPDGDNLTYTLLRNLGYLDAETGIYTLEPTADQVGSIHYVMVEVRDERGAASNVTFKISILEEEEGDENGDNNMQMGNTALVLIVVVVVALFGIIYLIIAQRQLREKADRKKIDAFKKGAEAADDYLKNEEDIKREQEMIKDSKSNSDDLLEGSRSEDE